MQSGSSIERLEPDRAQRSRAPNRRRAGRAGGTAPARARPARPEFRAPPRPRAPAFPERGARAARARRIRAGTRRAVTCARSSPTSVRSRHGHRHRAALAAQLAEDAAERFLRYVRIDTQSDEDSETYPSTAKQLDLLRLLVDELKEIGLADAAIDEHGYVTATLPATVDHDVPAIAFFAHVDTAREASGANVKPQRIRYDGGEITLGDSGQVIRPSESPQLEQHVGPRADHDRRHDAARRRRQVRHRGDHGRGRVPAGASRDPARPGQGRVQPGRRDRARRHPLPGRLVRRRRRVHRRRLDAPARCRARRSRARRCACTSAAARSIPAGRRASS